MTSGSPDDHPLERRLAGVVAAADAPGMRIGNPPVRSPLETRDSFDHRELHRPHSLSNAERRIRAGPELRPRWIEAAEVERVSIRELLIDSRQCSEFMKAGEAPAAATAEVLEHASLRRTAPAHWKLEGRRCQTSPVSRSSTASWLKLASHDERGPEA